MRPVRVLVPGASTQDLADTNLVQALAGLPVLEVVGLPSQTSLDLELQRTAQCGDDIVLLPSDCQPTADAIAKMLRVATLDAMMGFVAPWSNGGGAGGTNGIGGEISEFLYRLPEFTFVPWVDAAACWVSGLVLAEFGNSSVPSDFRLMMARANQVGFRVALANHAFIRSGKQRIGTRGPEKLPPETDGLHVTFQASPGKRAQDLLRQLHPNKGENLKVLFDFSHFTESYNGTFEAAIRFLASAVQTWPKSLEIAVAITEQAWEFHYLDSIPRIERVDTTDFPPAAIAFRIGQPHQRCELRRLFKCAPVVAIYMLDTIAYDCGYLSLDLDSTIWAAATQLSNLIVTNSLFTLRCLQNRFPPGSHTRMMVSRHSLSTVEYAPIAGCDKSGTAVMVVGNGYRHKFVPETVERIASRYPSLHLLAFGMPEGLPLPHNVTAVPSGNLSPSQIECLYGDARAVVFPSHYEGFGFPILHAIARKKPIFIRDNALNRELRELLPEAANIHLFSTTQELLELISVLPIWQPPTTTQQAHTWNDSTNEVWSALRACLTSTSQELVAARLTHVDLGVPPPLIEQLQYLSPLQRLALRIVFRFEKVLKPLVSTLRRSHSD